MNIYIYIARETIESIQRDYHLIYIALYFYVSSTVKWKNQYTDSLYISIYLISLYFNLLFFEEEASQKTS